MHRNANESWSRQARAQHGVISRAQLLGAGIRPARIRTMLGHGLLLPGTKGVYLLAPAPHTFDAQLWLAALSTDGVFVGSTAAFLWGMIDEHAGPVTVTVSSAVKVRLPPMRDIRVVRSDRLADGPRFVRFGLPVASRKVAALTHMGNLGRTEATAFADRAIQRRWLTVTDIEEWLVVQAPGNAVIRRALGTLVTGAEAESERVLHRLLRQAGVHGWKANHPVRHGGATVRIDVAFEAEKLAIEADGFRYHSKRDRYQSDRTKQNLLTVTGWTILRFTWEDLTQRPDYVIATIRAALNPP